MKWVTRERPKIDRIACPWLIRRFIDAEAEFLYVPAAQVLRATSTTRFRSTCLASSSATLARTAASTPSCASTHSRIRP